MSNLFDYSSNSGGKQTPANCCAIPTKGTCCGDCLYEILPRCDLPIITSSGFVSTVIGDDFSYVITATEVATYQVIGLPDWLTFDGVALISGTAPENSSYQTFLIVAQNECGQDKKNVTLTVNCDIPEATGIWDMPTFASPLGGGLFYAGTYVSMSYTPPSYPNGYVGHYTPYPIGFTQAQFNQLLITRTLVISSNIGFSGFNQSNPATTFEYSNVEDQGFTIPNQPNCTLTTISGSVGPLTYSIFAGSPQVYRLGDLFYPAIEIRHQDDTYLNLASKSSAVVVPKLWPADSTILGQNVSMLWDSFSEYDSFFGIPGDNGPWIQTTTGGITIA